MGRKSRRKRENRLNPPPPFYKPLETRWGTSSLARTWGGMLQGLEIGTVAGLAFGLIAAGRYAVLAAGGDAPGLEGIGWMAVRYVGGFLLGGAVAGALAPVRASIGGRRAQGIVMMAVTGLVWMPMLRQVTGGGDPGALWFSWAACSLIFGLMFAKWFGIHDELLDPPPWRDPDPELPSGRHPQFR